MAQSNFNSAVGANPKRSSDPSQSDVELELARQRAEERLEGALPQAEEPRGSPDALGTSYLGDGSSDEAWRRWSEIQSNFVDDPQKAVADAHGLVSQVIDGIVRRFETQRTELEQRWSSGEDVSTEELRRCLQSYRDFFGRLLTNLGEARTS
jgi:hypothetical protein